MKKLALALTVLALLVGPLFAPVYAGDQYTGEGETVNLWLHVFDVPYSVPEYLPGYLYYVVDIRPGPGPCITVKPLGVYTNAGISLGTAWSNEPQPLCWDAGFEGYAWFGEMSDGMSMIAYLYTYDEVTGVWMRQHGFLVWIGHPPLFFEWAEVPYYEWSTEVPPSLLEERERFGPRPGWER